MYSDRVSTTGSESRKSSKPIMEKRRRARINASLAELKSLLLEVIKKEGARHSKMEKADILEMAVKHLRQVQRQQYTSGGTDPTLSDKYRLGFNECAQEVSRYLGATDDDDAELRARLLNHLANCITSSPDSPSPLSTPASSPAPVLGGGGQVSSSSSSPGGAGVAPVVTPIPVRPVSAKTGSGMLSLIAAGEPGGSSPPAAATAVLVPTTEINNNNVALANNNLLFSSVTSGEVRHGAGNLHMTLSPAAVATSSSTERRVVGEVQVVGANPGLGGGGGEGVALVLPANVMTGGPLHSYIIPLYASHHPLATASLSLTPTHTTTFPSSLANNLSLNTVTTTTTAPQHTPSPATLPVMPSPSSSSSLTQVSPIPGTALPPPNLLTLTPGAAAVLPPASVGHVIATGLNGPLTWQTATPVYPLPVTAISSSSSSSSSLLPSSTSPLALSSQCVRSTENTQPSLEERVISSTVLSSQSFILPSVVAPAAPAAAVSASPAAAADSSSVVYSARASGCEGSAVPWSLLHSQLMRPQGAPSSSGLMPGADGCVWRPW